MTPLDHSSRRRRAIRVAALAALAGTLAFGLYLFVLYRQMESEFSRQDEHVPTRLYSDVTRIAAPQLRRQVEARLRALDYKLENSPEEIRFALRPIEYPDFLLPEGHPQREASPLEVTLSLSGPEPDAVVQEVRLNGGEVADVWLEPELVSTISRSEEKEIRDPVAFADIPAPVWKAIIAIEDQHFLDHPGFDLRGIARAIWVNLRTLSLAQGGSTITQQLVKNLMGRRTRNLFLKFNEFFLALLLEARYSKEEILERYLNEVNLGQVGNLEIHGVAEGAEHFFGKPLAELNLAEIALMAGLVRGTAYYSPYRHLDRALERQRLVLRKMVETPPACRSACGRPARSSTRPPTSPTTSKPSCCGSSASAATRGSPKRP
jgi:penicillin-binding protein 1B